MFKARIKETGEIAEFSTGKNLQGETILLKVGTTSFFKPEEVENIDQIGWHPASELPIIPEGEVRSVELAVYCKQANTLVLRNAVYYANGKWSELNVKWWSYPPGKE